VHTLLILVEQVKCRWLVVTEFILWVYGAKHLATHVIITVGSLNLHLKPFLTGLHSLAMRMLVRDNCTAHGIESAGKFQVFVNLIVICLHNNHIIFFYHFGSGDNLNLQCILHIGTSVIILFILIIFIHLFIVLIISSLTTVFSRKTEESLQEWHSLARNVYHEKQCREQEHKHKPHHTKHVADKILHNLTIAATGQHKAVLKTVTEEKIEEYRAPNKQEERYHSPTHLAHTLHKAQIHQCAREQHQERQSY
jgi:uncharacterized membrane protein